VKNQWSGYSARTTAKIVAFLSSIFGLKRVMISYTITLHNIANTPFTDRRIGVEHNSENNDTPRMKNMPGNKEATWASER
jgi:hypothetical protein